MCDLFHANPWKPLLCTNCHQNRAGHENISSSEHTCEHRNDLTSSSMHLYEEIMAQYFTVNSNDIEPLQSTSFIEELTTTNENDELDNDSFTDEEQERSRPGVIEFVANQSMVNTQGIVLIGPDLPSKDNGKKSKKCHLLRKSKSNADECLKKSDTIDSSPSKHWWFKAKKAPTTTTTTTSSNLIDDTNKSQVVTNKSHMRTLHLRRISFYLDVIANIDQSKRSSTNSCTTRNQ
jgi:hypothetical protein